MKALKYLAVILAILINSGCSASKVSVKDNPSRTESVYLAAISSGRKDAASYIQENLKLNKAYGYVKPYMPLVDPAEVRLVWIPAHKSEGSSDALVSGHWVYLMVKPSRWYIERQNKGKTEIPLIVPHKQEEK